MATLKKKKAAKKPAVKKAGAKKSVAKKTKPAAKPKAKAKTKTKIKVKTKTQTQKKPKAHAKSKANAKPLKTAAPKVQPKPKVSKPEVLEGLFTPLDDRVIVQVSMPENKTAGGIIIPDSALSNRPTQGTVVAVGRGHIGKKGRLKPMDVQVGDMILFADYAGQELKMGRETVFVMRETDVLGILG